MMKSRGCNLECVNVKGKKEEEVVEFVGPVKIVLVNQPKHAYRNKAWLAAFITLAQMLMGTITIIVVFYSLTYTKSQYMKALHVFLSTMGFQLSMPMGVLMLNVLTGAAAPMSVHDRKLEHGLLQIFSLGLVIIGAAVPCHAGYDESYTLHHYTGLFACGLTGLNVLFGITVFILSKFFYEEKLQTCYRVILFIHRFFGIVTVTVSSACFLSGIMKVTFKNWIPANEMFYVLMFCCVYCTIVVIYQPCKNL